MLARVRMPVVNKRLFIMPIGRERALQAVREALDGWRVTVREPLQKRDQQEKYHAMIDDISKQSKYAGQSWHEDDMKRILIDEFADEMRKAGSPLHHDGRLIPSRDGKRVIQLGIQSSRFKVKEASAFIEFLFAWGAEEGVKWSDPTLYPHDQS